MDAQNSSRAVLLKVVEQQAGCSGQVLLLLHDLLHCYHQCTVLVVSLYGHFGGAMYASGCCVSKVLLEKWDFLISLMHKCT